MHTFGMYYKFDKITSKTFVMHLYCEVINHQYWNLKLLFYESISLNEVIFFIDNGIAKCLECE